MKQLRGISPALLARLGLLALLIALFVWKGPSFRAVFAEIETFPILAFLLAAGLYALALVASAARLGVLVQRAESSISLVTATGLIFKAFALNSFTITGAGEAYKIAAINRQVRSVAVTVTLVLGERLIGVCSLLLLSLAVGLHHGLFTGLGFASDRWLPAVAILAIVLVAALWIARARQQVAARMSLGFLGKVLTSPRTCLGIILTTLVLLTAFVGSVMTLGLGMRIDLPWQVWAFVVPLVTIAGMMPLTFGGIGIREGGYLLLLADYGVPAPQAIALGVVQYGTILLACFIGAVWLSGSLSKNMKAKNKAYE